MELSYPRTDMHDLQMLNLLFCLTGLMAFLNFFFLVRRRLHREVPWFAIYLLTIVINEAVCDYLCLYVRPVSYWYYTGWFFQGTAVVLGSMFTIEAIRNALIGYPMVRKWARNILVIGGIAFLLITAMLLRYGSQDTDMYMKVTGVAMRSVRMIQLGVIVVFFAFTSYLALSWRHYQFGILLGYGLYVCVSLSAAAYSAKVGPSVGWNIMLIDSGAYILTLLGWLIYILRAEPKHPPDLPVSAAKDLDGWNDALAGLMKR